MKTDTALRQQLGDLLTGENAHANFESAVKDVPPAIRGLRLPGSQHTLWETLEHLRIAQSDILEFSRKSTHVSPPFPDGYWPTLSAPVSNAEWDESVEAFRRDLRELV